MMSESALVVVVVVVEEEEIDRIRCVARIKSDPANKHGVNYMERVGTRR